MSYWVTEPPPANDSRPVPGSCPACSYPLEHDLCRRCILARLAEGVCWRCSGVLDESSFCSDCGCMAAAKRPEPLPAHG